MDEKLYEHHIYEDENFPIIFHTQHLHSTYNFISHWHPNIELLCFYEGKCKIIIDTETYDAEPGDIILIPSNSLHRIISLTPVSSYYCLIADQNYFEPFGLIWNNNFINRKIKDTSLCASFNLISNEFTSKNLYYKPCILSETLRTLTHIMRYHTTDENLSLTSIQASRIETIKKVLSFINAHYTENISIDALADLSGFSKYHFCHIFKDATGITVTHYINSVRCRKAKELLKKGKCNVSEAASRCGFSNLSYFTRTYLKFNGELPSKTFKS